MKVCIYGAGAIGGWLGVTLARAGCALSVVARGATLAAVRANGLRLIEEGQALSAAVQASAEPAQLGVQDVVVIAVKEPAMAEVAAGIAPLLGPDTAVVTAMNGVPWWFFQGFGGPYAGTRLKSVDADGRIAAAVPAAQVVGCVVHASCSLEGPGLARRHFGRRLTLGTPSGEKSARVRGLAELMLAAGLEASVSEQIQKDVWYKLWGNMTMNPISAITGATADRVLDDPLVLDFIDRVMLEAREIGGCMGIPIEQSPADRHAVTRKLGAFKTSMLQDVEAGRPVELNALVAVVRELGQITGVATPNTDALLGLARLHARVRGLY